MPKATRSFLTSGFFWSHPDVVTNGPSRGSAIRVTVLISKSFAKDPRFGTTAVRDAGNSAWLLPRTGNQENLALAKLKAQSNRGVRRAASAQPTAPTNESQKATGVRRESAGI